MPGSQTSRMMRSTPPRVMRSRHDSLLDTASTVYPSFRSTPLRELRTPGSSSTIRMVGFTGLNNDSWRIGESANWRIGELENWRLGELESYCPLLLTNSSIHHTTSSPNHNSLTHQFTNSPIS